MVSETQLDELQWRSPEWVNSFGLRTDNVLEYFSQSPFFDRTSSNQVLKMQNQFTDSTYNSKPYDLLLQDLKKMKGVEFVIAMVREPDFWIIRKQNRLSETETVTLADYYIIGSNVYMAPLIHSIMSSRFLSSVLNLRNSMGILQTLPEFSPSNGHQYNFQRSSSSAASSSSNLTEGINNTNNSASITTSVTSANKEDHSNNNNNQIPESSANAFNNLLNLSLQNNAIYLDEMPVTGINETALNLAAQQQQQQHQQQQQLHRVQSQAAMAAGATPNPSTPMTNKRM